MRDLHLGQHLQHGFNAVLIVVYRLTERYYIIIKCT